MSHYQPAHRAPKPRRDALRARARDTWTRAARLARWYFAVAEWRALAAGARALNAVFLDVTGLRPAAKSPAPGAAPGQAPPPPDAGAVPSPAAADAAAPPAADAATLPPPAPPQVTGRGQHLPWVTSQDPPGTPMRGQHPYPAWRGDYRPTQPFRAVGELTAVSVVRPYYPALERYRDSTARWTA